MVLLAEGFHSHNRLLEVPCRIVRPYPSFVQRVASLPADNSHLVAVVAVGEGMHTLAVVMVAEGGIPEGGIHVVCTYINKRIRIRHRIANG